LSILYIVATPIGNLQDTSSRAVETLQSVDLIASEDTRVTRKLLSHYDIKTRTISFNRINAKQRTPILLKHLESKDLALTSDAGTPGISDPGHELIAAIDQTMTQVIPIPGPSAVTAILSAAPFPTDRFYFTGFAPRKKVELDQLINTGSVLSVPIVMFESPKRVIGLLSYLENKIPNTKIFIMREITKRFEDSFYGTVTEAKNHFLSPGENLQLSWHQSWNLIQHLTSKGLNDLSILWRIQDLSPVILLKASLQSRRCLIRRPTKWLLKEGPLSGMIIS